MVGSAVAGGATGRGLQIKVKIFSIKYFHSFHQDDATNWLFYLQTNLPGLWAWRFACGGG